MRQKISIHSIYIVLCTQNVVYKGRRSVKICIDVHYKLCHHDSGCNVSSSYPPQRSGDIGGTAAWAEAGDGLLPTPDGSFNKCGGGGGWDQQSRDHQVPPPWNPGWNNAGCKSIKIHARASLYLACNFAITAYHEGSWGYYENYNYKNPAAFDNYHWGKYPTNEWSNKNNSRHYRDYRQATRHPYHRDPRPANHGTGTDYSFSFGILQRSFGRYLQIY